MRRPVIFGLMILLAGLIWLDFHDAAEQQAQLQPPPMQVMAPTLAPAPELPPATITPPPTATTAALQEVPPGTVEALMVTLTAMENAALATPTEMRVAANPQPLPFGPTTINGVTYDAFVSLPGDVQQRIREIYAYGQSIGNNPRAFSKLGDSTIEYPHFLARFDEGEYNLGDYAYLQPVIDYYAGSFGHRSIAIRRGLHTWSVLDPMWAGGPCNPGENMLACEIRVHRPSILFIRLGSNDAGVPQSTERNFREIVDFVISSGVIPVIGTKADRHEGSNINNDIMRRVAAEYHVPLMDFDQVALTLPGRGLGGDSVHMTTFYAHDYRQPEAFQRGHSLHNLTALVTLDLIWRVLREGEA